MAITVPNSASTYSSDSCAPNTQSRWLNVGFVANPGGSGSCFFFTGSSLATGSPLMPIVCASGAQTWMSPLFNATCNLVAACISSGCAIIWAKAASSA